MSTDVPEISVEDMAIFVSNLIKGGRPLDQTDVVGVLKREFLGNEVGSKELLQVFYDVAHQLPNLGCKIGYRNRTLVYYGEESSLSEYTKKL